MTKLRYVYFQSSSMWVGWLEEYPEYATQGETLEELEENLRDIYGDISEGNIPGLRHIGELLLK